MVHSAAPPLLLAAITVMCTLVVSAAVAWLARMMGSRAIQAVYYARDVTMSATSVAILMLAVAAFGSGYLTTPFALTAAYAPALTSRMLDSHPLRIRRLMGIAAGLAALAVTYEAALSFLRLGPSGTTLSWGATIAEGREHLSYAPEVSLVPAVFLMLTLWSLTTVAGAMGLGEQNSQSGSHPGKP